MDKPWVGYDLDGTLAEHSDKPMPFIGPPVPAMVEHLLQTVASGKEVRIFTARASTPDFNTYALHRRIIDAWCTLNLGRTFEITCVKDIHMEALYDDRAFHVVPNTGRIIRPDDTSV